jgi:Fic family protein
MDYLIFLERLSITPEMVQLIAEIDQFKGSWQAFKQMAPEQLNALKHVATIESVGSSTRIEGAKLSDNEVEKLLGGLNTQSFRSRDEEEVAGYAYTLETIFANYEHIPLTENYIKQLHAMLLQYSGKDVRHRGEYKKFPNHVEAFDADGKSVGIIFETTPPFETMEEMRTLIAWTQEALQEKRHHPLLIIGTFIVLFLAIHPFQDGNGRLSRIVTTLLLLKTGYAYVPYSSLEAIIEDNKQGYYLALRRTQSTFKKDNPDLHPWLLYFLRILQKQKQHLEAKLVTQSR